MAVPEPVIQRDQVGGVTILWADSGRPQLRASLAFRAGVVDEVMPTRGWTHLLEHAALHGTTAPSGTPGLAVNGSTWLLYTSLDATGSPQGVAQALGRAAQHLAQLDPAAIQTEAKVLAAEASRPIRRTFNAALLHHFGVVGPGLVATMETGLPLANPEALASFAANRFTSGNAVLCLDGPPPPGLAEALAQALPGGPRRPVPPPVQLPNAAGVYKLDGGGGVVASAVLPRAGAPGTMARLLRQRVAEAAWRQLGLEVQPEVNLETLGPDQLWLALGLWVTPQDAAAVAQLVVAQARQLAAEGPRQVELSDQVEVAQTDLAAAVAKGILPWQVGQDFLLGRPVKQPAELGADLQVGAHEVAATAGAFIDGLALAVPPTVPATDYPLPPCPRFLAEPVKGRRHRIPFGRGDMDGSSLVVGHQGLSVANGGVTTAFPWDQVVAFYHWPDGARELLRRDGVTFLVDPADWRRGQRVTEQIDRALPPQVALPGEPRETRPRPRLAVGLLGEFLYSGSARRQIGAGLACFLACLLVGAVAAFLTFGPGGYDGVDANLWQGIGLACMVIGWSAAGAMIILEPFMLFQVVKRRRARRAGRGGTDQP
ncbi:MAG: hypothetical protein LBR27_04405 [Bifidobacteriaceae bacterium]|jgi:hypothetical protein|nr:hypothetical protein [Bifidobacteriaceae bacterium]